MSDNQWTINTDIYDIVNSVKNVEKKYIEDEDETTLSLGIFGYITDVESKKIQTATIMAGQLGNEMFPTRANLTKNVLTHAAYNGIEEINAVPAQITITLCMKSSDIADHIDEDGCFFIDAKCPIFIDEYEFHLDYDVKIKRKKVSSRAYTYSAQYIVMDENDNPITNRLSDIINPYLKQPFIINIGNEEYVAIQCTIRQCTIEETNDTMTSDSIIENKSYTFQFENQIADFQVYVTENNNTIELTPCLYGSTPSTDDKYYCWYLFTADNTIRITFDSTCYIPGLNADIYIKAYTTIGSSGNFEYLNIDQTSEGLFITMESDTYNYKSLNFYLVAVTDSHDGSDRKTKEELQKLIPKAALARGNITTETDLNNYFNLINNDICRLEMRKKVDNQLERIWYGYFVLKDDNNNIIPSNTIDIRLSAKDLANVVKTTDGRLLIPAGTVIRLDTSDYSAGIIDASQVPTLYSDTYFNNGYYYYMTVYNTLLCTDPLFCSYFMTACNYDSYFMYDYVNQDAEVQFIANRFHMKKNLLTDQDIYLFTFNIAQSITDTTFVAYEVEEIERTDPDTGTTVTDTIVSQNVKVILVLYRDGEAYRWKECTLDVDKSDFNACVYSFYANMMSNSEFDDLDRIKIEELNVAGETTKMYGFVDAVTEAKIFILSNITVESTEEYPREDIDNIAPGYEDYTVTNIYKCIDGITFFEDTTKLTNTKVTLIDPENEMYKINGVPVVGKHYLESETEVSYLIEAINERKAYIDYCLTLVENSMNIDFKFYNTYGPSRTYTLEDEKTYIGHIDLNMHFKLSLKDSTDSTIITSIKDYIKNYIEDLDNTGKDFHGPNLITDISNEYGDRINFIEFLGFNKYNEDDQHIVVVEPDDQTIAPEFINIRNYRDQETLELVPNITIDIV